MVECQINGCKRRAKFNFVGSENASHCDKHQLQDMMQIRQNYCRYCTKISIYGYASSGKWLTCKDHKKPDMVDVKNPKCIECKKQPTYNFEGQSKGIYCVDHKKENMVDVKHPRCKHDKCRVRPVFNFVGENKGLYCADHKKENMIDVVNPTCTHDGCRKQPCFNFDGSKTGIYCSDHRKENMVNVTDKRCERDGCMTYPVYNFEGETIGLYCYEHKEDNMVDVKSTRCAHPDCTIRPYYNFMDELKGLYCNYHKKENMVDVVSPRCKTPLCDTIVHNKYQGYCFRCFIHMFPDSELTRNYKTKELYVVNKIEKWLNEKHSDLSISFDRKIEGGCSLRRPDMFIDMLTHVIIIEVDENQHKQTSCETLRLVQLFEDVAQRPCVFIRFNPDGYTDKSGKKHKSCFKYTKKGLCVIDSEVRMDNRLVPVYEALSVHITTPLEKSIHVEQYWYDS